MFFWGRGLTSLELSSFDSTKVISAVGLLQGCNTFTRLSVGEATKLQGADLPDNNWKNKENSWIGTSDELVSRSMTGVKDTYYTEGAYATKAVNVTVKYVDEAHHPLSDDVVKRGYINDSIYHRTKNIERYTFKAIKGSAASGPSKAEAQTVTYVYIKNLVKVIDTYRLYNPKLKGEITAIKITFKTKRKHLFFTHTKES